METINKPKSVYEAFKIFKERFLEEKKSIFSENDEIIYTPENVEFIFRNFSKSPIEGTSTGFDEKINKQLEGASREQKILFAHVIWAWFIFANDMNRAGKIKSIKNWVQDWTDETIIPEGGIGSTGQYHKTNKPNEIAYVIDFLRAFLDANNTNYVEIIKELGTSANIDRSSVRKVAMYNIFLHLFDPENYERIASYGHKEKIISFFQSIFDDLDFPNTYDLDRKLKDIRARCLQDRRFQNKKVIFNDGERFDFYQKEIRQLWISDVVLESKNMILHGPPGTGKTFSVENSIKNRLAIINGESHNLYTLVQFHPSYGYEDFIDGIKPANLDSDGHFRFELVNGQFKNLCIRAFKELKLAKHEKRKPEKFYFVADEINRAELSRVFGELLVCIEEDKRLRFVNEKLAGTKVKTQNSNLWKKEHAVVILNEQGEISEDGNDFYFGIPDNILFIGTMNDIDRSVDSFDMALRRRFFWKSFCCDYDVIRDHYEKYEYVDQYVGMCEALNKHISNEKGLNLGDSYQLGHSYFLKPTSLSASQLDKVWTNNIAPLLKEYLRAEYPENEIKSHLDKAKTLYSWVKNDKNN